MAIEIVDSPIKNGDFPVRYVSLPEGMGNQMKQWGIQYSDRSDRSHGAISSQWLDQRSSRWN
jgi:hypothetical protein